MKNTKATNAPDIPKPDWKNGIFYRVRASTAHPERTRGIVSIPWGIGISHPLDENGDYALTHLHSGLRLAYYVTSLTQAHSVARQIRETIDTAQGITPILKEYRRRHLTYGDLLNPPSASLKKARK